MDFDEQDFSTIVNVLAMFSKPLLPSLDEKKNINQGNGCCHAIAVFITGLANNFYNDQILNEPNIKGPFKPTWGSTSSRIS